MVLGALEAGGTKMVCAVGDENGAIVERAVFPTRTPETTIPQMIEFFKKHKIEALGIGCFGPIDLNKSSDTYGYITSTPKLAWQNYDICGAFEEALGCPVGFDTDVNGSCLGEMNFGAAKDCKNVVYITIGTGVGMGIAVDGKLVHGILHPEAGHMLVKRVEGDTFEGICPFHKDCLEGLVCGGAIGARYGVKAYEIAKEDIAWDYTATYIAEGVMNLILTLAPEKIILGGGVMEQEHMVPLIREKLKTLMADYLKAKELSDLEHYIVRPGCEGEQGILGALLLAKFQKISN